MTGRRTRLTRQALRLLRPMPPRLRDAAAALRSAPVRLGAVAVVRDDAGRWLVARHSYRRGWGLPGGGLRKGEDPTDGVRRELREELGVVVDADPPVVMILPNRRNLVFLHAATILEGEPAAISPEIEEVRWLLPAEISGPDRFLEAVLADVVHRLDAGDLRPIVIPDLGVIDGD